MNRKEFLALSALGFVGLSCGIRNSRNLPPKLAIQLYTVRNAVAENLEKTLEKLVDLGFSELEIYGYDGTFFGKNRKEFKTIIQNTAMRVISSHHVTGVSAPHKGTFLNQWESTLEDLNFIGAEYAVCAYIPDGERTAEHYRKLPDILNKTGGISKQYGIQLAYHNHDFEFHKMDENHSFYDFILQNTSSDLVKMEIDLYWIAKAGLDPLDYFKKYPQRFPLWHVKDMKAGSEDFAEIGQGTIDFKRIFAAKEQAGMKHWFLEQDSSDKDIFESISISRKYILQNSYFL